MNITRGRLTSTLLATLLCQALPAQAAPAYLASVIPQPVITPDPTPTFRNAAGGVARMVAPDTIVKTPLPDITHPDYTRVQRFIQTGWQMDVTDATGVHAISNMGRSNGDIVGMADSGQVMGSVFDYVQHRGTPKDPKLGLPSAWGSFDQRRAFVYQNGVTTLIETPTGQDTHVYAMNRKGQALVQAESPTAQGWNGKYQAFYYNQGQLTDFGADTHGMAISQNGQALAQYQRRGENGDVLEMEARVFDNGQVRGLGAGTFAHLMNDHGTVAGTAMVGDQFQTFIYRNGKTQVIAETAARGTIEKLTEHDQVVGIGLDPTVGRERTFVFHNGETTFLHGVSTSPDDLAFVQDFFKVESINKHGAVLGWGVGNPYHEIPMLYENGQYTLLAPLLAAAADAANVLRPDVFGLRLLDDGSIVGWTNSKLDGSLRYVSFAPVPEPGTWLLMSLGLWAVGLVRGHHTKRTHTQTLQA